MTLSPDDKTYDPAKPLEEGPYFKEAIVPHALDVHDPSTVSLHLLVKNGDSVVGRLMDNVGAYVHEVVAVLNDCTDETEVVLATACASYGIPFVPIKVTHQTHPHLYILDVKETYEFGRSLGNEEFAGPFTGHHILADWAAARNLGWKLCTSSWRLFLDADDVVADPHAIPGLIKLLEQYKVEIAGTPYEFHLDVEGRPLGRSVRERLAVNNPRIRWVLPVHEVLAGSARQAHIQQSMIVRDMRDSKGAGIRIPGRNFKVLYHYARYRDWEVSPRILANILMEVRHMVSASEGGMMEFAQNLCDRYLREATWPEERAWVLGMLGEMKENCENLDGAIADYEESLLIHPGSKMAFRLCRALFKKGCVVNEADQSDAATVVKLKNIWRSCIAAFEAGVANKAAHQVLDDGPAMEEMETIHVAGAYLELGDVVNARVYANRAIAAFPENSSLKIFNNELNNEFARTDRS
jgi:glycosyltransferase involved in cell wall biosynthesis